MDYSTPITRKLVKAVMEDIVKIIVDLKANKSKSTG
jgi:predicted secreted protein